MKKLIIILFTISTLHAQPIAKVDTIYRKLTLVSFKPDTVNFNLLKNDQGANLKIIEFSINCVRFTSISTFKTITNFGKIKLNNLGVGAFITTKYVPTSPIIYEFFYTINDGKCGTSQGKVVISDSSYYYTSNRNYAWTYSNEFGWGYYLQEGNLYFIQFKGLRLVATEQEFQIAILNKP